MAEQMDFAKWNAELAKNNQKLSEVKEEIVKSNEKAEEELDLELNNLTKLNKNYKLTIEPEI